MYELKGYLGKPTRIAAVPQGGTGKLRTYRHLYLWCCEIIKRCAE